VSSQAGTAAAPWRRDDRRGRLARVPRGPPGAPRTRDVLAETVIDPDPGSQGGPTGATRTPHRQAAGGWGPRGRLHGAPSPLCKHARVAGDDAAFEEWRARRAREGAHVDVLDLYDLVAEARGIAPEALPSAEREALADRAMPVIWPGFERVGHRRRPSPVVLADPDPTWPARFAAWREALTEALGPAALRVEHIGSTSVPGLAAKPIVDVLLSVREPDDEVSYVPGCEKAGLELFSRDDEHRFLVNAAPATIDAHVHACEVDGAFERDHLLFRDYLRADDAERRAYEALKRAAAAHWQDDRMAYTYAKNGWILDLLQRAGAWAARTGWAVPRAGG